MKKREIACAVPDATALKALAHPDRLRMLGILRLEGPATATGLAQQLSLNSGATSYHLRQLAAHGFVEHATDLGNKRERWWRAKHETTSFDPTDASGEQLEAGMAWSQGILAQQALLMQRALEQFPQLSRDWREASDASDYIFMMTAEQAISLKEKVTALLRDEMRKSPSSDTPRPAGTKPFMVLLHAFPFLGHGNGVKGDDNAT